MPWPTCCCGVYAPLPAATLSWLVHRLRFAAPQWQSSLKATVLRAKARAAHALVDGVHWYWPAGETMPGDDAPDAVRLLTPFDPVVWDRRRFELFWGWAYRFEAYTPEAKRKLGYYALPLLWRDRVDRLGQPHRGRRRAAGARRLRQRPRPRERAFAAALDAELRRCGSSSNRAAQGARQAQVRRRAALQSRLTRRS